MLRGAVMIPAPDDPQGRIWGHTTLTSPSSLLLSPCSALHSMKPTGSQRLRQPFNVVRTVSPLAREQVEKGGGWRWWGKWNNVGQTENEVGVVGKELLVFFVAPSLFH